MPESTLLHRISQKNSNKEKIAKRVIKSPELIPELFRGIGNPKASIKFGCAKILRILSEQHPTALYSHMGFFMDLLDSDNKILLWDGISIIGNLAKVDKDKKIDVILDRYLSPIPGPVMITAANVIGGAAKIALAKPYLSGIITTAILQVEQAKYQTTECRNVALGHAITSLDLFYEHIEDKKTVIDFIRRQLNNTRNSTVKKAEMFLQKRGC